MSVHLIPTEKAREGVYDMEQEYKITLTLYGLLIPSRMSGKALSALGFNLMTTEQLVDEGKKLDQFLKDEKND